ncbi:MAG: porin [Paracoccaceae bacterium]
MKKVLFATTALVFSAGIAAAEVTVSGSANAGFKYNEGDLDYAGKKAAGWYEIDMDVTGTTETDSGLTFGATVELDSDYASAREGTEGLAGSVFVSGAFGTFTIGSVDPMADDSGISDIGFDGIGVDDVAGNSIYTGSADARWDYSTGALSLGVSLHTIEEDYGLSVGYDFGMASVLVAYDHDEYNDDTGNENDSASILLTAEMSGIEGQLFFADSDDYDQSWGVYAAYTTGALTLEAAYGDYDGAADAAYGIGAKYDLGGATLAGGVGKVDDMTVADLGVSFSF